MLKIKDESGKIIGVLEDDKSEPEMKEEECCDCKCHEKEDGEECEKGDDCCQKKGEQ